MAKGQEDHPAMPSPALDERKLEAEVTSILRDLIALRSDFPPGDTRAICGYAGDRLARAGYAVETHENVAPLANLVARLGRGRPCIMFNAHADTVGVGEAGGWTSDPFAATERDGRLFGLGASNCKGAMAVHLWLAEEIARRGGPGKGEVMFSFVGDEENLGPDGTCYLREAGLVKPDILIVGADTENQLITAERGVMWVRVSARGRAAHAGDPSAGDNAIERMMRLIGALGQNLAPGLEGRRDGAMQSTVNLGLIRGGYNTNVVPSQCTVEIDRRLLPGETVAAAFAEIRQALETAGEPAGSFDAELLRGTNGFKSTEDGPAARAFRQAIAARTGRPARDLFAMGVFDGRYFADDGIEIIDTGPGSQAEGHAANESVSIPLLVDSAIIHLYALGRLLTLPG